MSMLIARCPNCKGELTYEKGFPGSYWEPPLPEQLYCENPDCEWEAEDGEINDYVVYQEGE